LIRAFECFDERYYIEQNLKEGSMASPVSEIGLGCVVNGRERERIKLQSER
jgi:hypothetical protein